ncbi:unnamed protein product, partial [Ectocarpus sp. 12 AP-2014]
GWVGRTKGSRRCRERSPKCTFACCGLRCVLVVATCSCTIRMYMTRCLSIVPVRCCQVAVEMCFSLCSFIVRLADIFKRTRAIFHATKGTRTTDCVRSLYPT